MPVIYRLVGAYLLLLGAAIGAYFLVFPLYGGRGDVAGAFDIWNILNWFMAVGAVLAVLGTYVRKRRSAEEAANRLMASGSFYFAVILFFLFFNNWFHFKWGGPDLPPEPISWLIVDVGMAIVYVRAGLTLVRDPESISA